MLRTTLTLKEAVLLSAICFGLPIFWSLEAVFSGFPDAEFSSSGAGWMIGLELVLSTAALVYLKSRRFQLATLCPHPSIRGTLIGIGLFFTAWLVGAVVVAPLQSNEKRQIIDFAFSGMTVASVVAFSMVNGAFEEVFLLGALVNGLRGYGISVAVGLPLLVRILYHLYQGPLGAVWVLSFGIVLTLGYIATRQLWPSVFAHTLWDIVPMLLGSN